MDKSIMVVSGLPRSGTSLMMKMLRAGGVPILSDGARRADLDNPGGYYELEEVKTLKDGDHSWLEDANGKVVKVVAPLLFYLPADYSYRVVFMRRDIEEVLASQNKMLERRGKLSDSTSDEKMGHLFQKQLDSVLSWMQGQENIDFMEIYYADLVSVPLAQIQSLGEFLDLNLPKEDMARVVDTRLYRHRAAS